MARGLEERSWSWVRVQIRSPDGLHLLRQDRLGTAPSRALRVGKDAVPVPSGDGFPPQGSNRRRVSEHREQRRGEDSPATQLEPKKSEQVKRRVQQRRGGQLRLWWVQGPRPWARPSSSAIDARPVLPPPLVGSDTFIAE